LSSGVSHSRFSGDMMSLYAGVRPTSKLRRFLANCIAPGEKSHSAKCGTLSKSRRLAENRQSAEKILQTGR